MMEKYKYVFVVLVYKNVEVLRDFFLSLKINDYKVIVVNSYYDDKSMKECETIAHDNNADFIPVDNKGFGYGNNIGSKYVIDNYQFNYLILSNSDIQIIDIGYLDNIQEDAVVVSPHTSLPNGRVQNPNIPWRFKPLLKLFKVAYDKKSRLLLFFARIFTRGSRELFRVYHFFYRKHLYNVYCCHGSFLIFTKKAVETLYPIFDDRMFLYNEELYLAEKCRIKKIQMFYCPEIGVLHLEGASTGTRFDFERFKESYSILYEWMIINNCL